MIRKSAKRFSDKIMREQNLKARWQQAIAFWHLRDYVGANEEQDGREPCH
jgi:hypothetical protein